MDYPLPVPTSTQVTDPGVGGLMITCFLTIFPRMRRKSIGSNIARGTTDPEIDSVTWTWTKFGNQIVSENIGLQNSHLFQTQICFPMSLLCSFRDNSQEVKMPQIFFENFLKICENLLKDNLCIKTLPEAQLTQKLTP